MDPAEVIDRTPRAEHGSRIVAEVGPQGRADETPTVHLDHPVVHPLVLAVHGHLFHVAVGFVHVPPVELVVARDVKNRLVARGQVVAYPLDRLFVGIPDVAREHEHVGVDVRNLRRMAELTVNIARNL